MCYTTSDSRYKNMVEIICLVISAISLVALIVLGVLLLRKQKENSKPVDDTATKLELGKLINQIDALEKDLKKDIEVAVNKEMLHVLEIEGKNQELNNEKLERFQKNIVESLNTRFEHINKELADKLKEMNDKVENKLKEGSKILLKPWPKSVKD